MVIVYLVMFTNKFSTKTYFTQLINLKKQNEDSLIKKKKKEINYTIKQFWPFELKRV